MQVLGDRTNRRLPPPPPADAKTAAAASRGRALVCAAAPLQGYLLKLKSKSSITGSWNKRWFAVNAKSKALSYWQSEAKAACAPASGCLKFDEILGVHAFGPCQFQVDSDVRPFLLKAKSTEERDKWLARLQHCVALCRPAPSTAAAGPPESKERAATGVAAAAGDAAPDGASNAGERAVAADTRPAAGVATGVAVETGMLTPATMSTACATPSSESTFFTAQEGASTLADSKEDFGDACTSPVPEPKGDCGGFQDHAAGNNAEAGDDEVTAVDAASPAIPTLPTRSVTPQQRACVPAVDVDTDSSDDEDDLDYAALARGDIRFASPPRPAAATATRPQPTERTFATIPSAPTPAPTPTSAPARRPAAPGATRSPVSRARSAAGGIDMSSWDDDDDDNHVTSSGEGKEVEGHEPAVPAPRASPEAVHTEVTALGAGVQTDTNWVDEDWDDDDDDDDEEE